jgi:hypothetical protein
MVTIDSEVPFGRICYAWVHVHEFNLEMITRHNWIETHYLAWETVRKQINPFFETGTGFEGYLVSRCANPEAALETVLDISQQILDSLDRQYLFESSFRSRLMKTLVRDTEDLEAIQIWSTCLGAELARLRAQILVDEQAQAFREQTYKMVKTLPPIMYKEVDDDITQTYTVASENVGSTSKLFVTLQMLKPSQQDAWLVAKNIGQFGHPLVRQLLTAA